MFRIYLHEKNQPIEPLLTESFLYLRISLFHPACVITEREPTFRYAYTNKFAFQPYTIAV